MTEKTDLREQDEKVVEIEMERLVPFNNHPFKVILGNQKQEREIWTAEMLMQALEACDNKMLKIAFHLAFTATLRIGELLGLTWDDMDISEEAIADNRAYVYINKEVERVSKQAVEELNSKDIILIFPSQKKNNKTVRV